MGRLVVAIAVFASVALPGIAQAALFPANDDFVRQRAIAANHGSAQLATATRELGEPAFPAATAPVRSAWWVWVAPRSGWAEVQSCSSTFTPLLGIYTGFGVAQLAPLPTTTAPTRCQRPQNYTHGTTLRFYAVEGTAYRIVAATDSPLDGAVTANVQQQPANDDFADAAPFATDLDGHYVALGLATVEPGEPAHGGRAASHSAWYAYTPARDERIRFEVCNAGYTPVLGTATVYRGTTLAGLTEIASSEDAPDCGATGDGGQVEALLDANVAYRIALTQDDPTAEEVLVQHARSPRDDSATTPSKLSSGSVDLKLATHEAGEPEHAGQTGGRSRWKVLTPDVSTTYEISSCPRDTVGHPAPDALLAVYEGAVGTPANALTPVAANDNGCPAGGTGALVRFRALAGHRYLVALDSKGGVPGTLELTVVPAPGNDDRDRAHPIKDYRIGSRFTTLATAEPGEPAHAGSPAAHSIWHRWVAPRDGTVNLALCNNGFDAVVAVYGVDESQPALAAAQSTPGCREAGSTTTSTGPHLALPVTAGRTYLIAVDGKNGSKGTTGPLTIAYTLVPNDDLAGATSLASSSDSSVFFAASAAATAQTNEPAHAGRAAEHSSWWRWTATRTGFVTLETCADDRPSSNDTTLAVYTGDAMNALRPVAAADDGCGAAGGAGNASLSFYAQEGEIYRIAADVHGATAGASLSLWVPPANDRFDRATDLTAKTSIGGNLSGATREPGEPDHAGRVGGRSLWYTWTAAHTGLVEMSACGYLDTLLGVYTGTAVDSLMEVAASDDGSLSFCEENPGGSLVRFTAQAGTTYKIAIDGKDGAFGEVGLNVRTSLPADRFATAQSLGPRPGTAEVDLSLTGAEAGEPAHAGRAAVRSSWLRFTPSTTYVVEISSCSYPAGADTRLAAYTGSTLSALTPVAADDASPGCSADANGARIRFRVIAGVSYSIAVDASTATHATVAFRLLPANDNLSDAPLLALTPGTVVTDTLRGATSEAGEPEHGAGATAVSAWYRVHVDTARTVRLTACPRYAGYGSAARLVAYTGSSIATLQPLPDAVTSICSNGSAGGRIMFSASPSSDVLLAVANPGPGNEYELRVEDVPPNDLFAAAAVIADRGGEGSVGEAGHAGREPGEPQHAGESGGHSLWWSYTPTTDRVVDVYACAEQGDPLVAAYTGASVDALSTVAIGVQKYEAHHCADLTFTARAGATYRIALDVEGAAAGSMRLTLSPRLPDHTSFAAAQPLAIPASIIDEFEGPQPQPGEPVHANLGGRRSVWFRLNPTADELLDISSCGVNGADTVVAVYTGAAVDALTEVASDEDERVGCSFGRRDAHVAVPVHAGTVYWIAVDAALSTDSDGTFQLKISRRAPHDAFDDPFELVPAVPVIAWTGTASAESGEPDHDGVHAAKSVWAAWTADRTGRAVVKACTDDYVATHLGAYTGNSVDALTPVASNDDGLGCPGTDPAGARIEFDTVAGQRYHVAVDEQLDWSAAEVTLHLAPDNDDRAAAAALPAAGSGADVDLTAAGLEAGEPSHAGVRGAGSAWYEVTPAATGGLEVNTCATEPFDTVLAVYEPAGAAALTPVAQADAAPAAARAARERACAGARRRATRTSSRSPAPRPCAGRRTWTSRRSRRRRRARG